MAYVEFRTAVEHRTIAHQGAANTAVVDIIDWMSYIVYDRPYTGGDDTPLLERHYTCSWENIPA